MDDRGSAASGPCLLAATEAGEPLRPAILYGIDTRATAEIAELTEAYGADKIVERCGSPLIPPAIGPKLLWLRRNEPTAWERTVVSSWQDRHQPRACGPAESVS